MRGWSGNVLKRQAKKGGRKKRGGYVVFDQNGIVQKRRKQLDEEKERQMFRKLIRKESYGLDCRAVVGCWEVQAS